MNRLAVPLLWLTAAAVLASCTDSNTTVYILRNQVLTSGCLIPNGSGTDFVGFGELDVTEPIPGTNFANPGYILAAAVQNGTTSNATLPNAHIFYAMGADVELRSNGSSASEALVTALSVRDLANRTQHFAASIPPGSTAGVGFPIIDLEQTEALNQILGGQIVQIIARSKMFGTIDGNSITADPYDFPVTVCLGCLVNDLGLCSSLSKTATFSSGGECNKIQDSVLDCCTTDTGATQCPPVLK